ncbi:MAG: cytochrome c biogenesis protein CcsA [Pseudomonadota bacterium]
MAELLTCIGVLGYAIGTWLLSQHFRWSTSGEAILALPPMPWVALALLVHAGALYLSIVSADGLNLSFMNAASLIAWSIATILATATLIRPLITLGLIVWPFAALVLVLAAVFPGEHMLRPEIGLGVRVHATLSILAYSLLAIGACQAILLYVLEYGLRHRKPGIFLRALPPMQLQEQLLLQWVGLGFFLLSLSLASGMMFVEDFFAQHLVHKSTLSIAAWAIFGGVLWGRWRHGWRGRTLVGLCLAGFAVLVLAYFGSKLVLEVILGRSWTRG